MAEQFAVYAGSFDPPTIGHLWMIRQGAGLFDRLQVAVGVNPEKKAMFGVDERLEMLREITADLPNVTIASFSNQFLVHYAKAVGARFILRGIRNTTDFEFERTMRNINAENAPEISTVFLMPAREVADVSSSFVKGLIGPEGWADLVKRYVAPPVFDRIRRKRAGTV